MFRFRTNPDHVFTTQYPNDNYTPTTASAHPQTPYWPAYLPPDPTRLVIFERSKNAQLVIYSAHFRDNEHRVLDPKTPLDIQWHSFGWTPSPTTNATGLLERKLAWGYSSEAVDPKQFRITLNALPSREATLCIVDDQPQLQVTIDAIPSRLWKIFVSTDPTTALIPKVRYVDLYGTAIATSKPTYERIVVNA